MSENNGGRSPQRSSADTGPASSRGSSSSSVIDSIPNGPTQGKVAQILNARELVINLGASHGVERGMRYKVMSEPGAEIFDPDTHASLGRLEREKVRVEIVDVLDRMAVGKTYETRIVPDDFTRWVRKTLGEIEVVETIPSTKSPGWVRASDWDAFVSVGDRVKLIEEDEHINLSED